MGGLQATVLFVEVGHSQTTAALARFDPERNSVVLLDVAVATVGGRDFVRHGCAASLLHL